jgi:hypothetical protein
LIELHDIADCPYAKNKKFAPKCNGLMEELKGQLQSIADAYKKAISEEPSSDDWKIFRTCLSYVRRFKFLTLLSSMKN